MLLINKNIFEMEHQCSECQTSYSTVSNLRKHVRKFHSKDISKLAPLRYKKSSLDSHIKCSVCKKTFNHRQSLRRHTRIHVSVPPTKAIKNAKKCPLCQYGASLRKEFLNHFQNVHEIPLQWHNFSFSSSEDFQTWKMKTEIEAPAKFIKTKTETFKSHTKILYVCHRSGNYFPKGKGIRHLKTQGSNKINAYCPAHIQLFRENDGNLKVKYLETHVGHKLDIVGTVKDMYDTSSHEVGELHIDSEENEESDAIITQLAKKPKMKHSIEERYRNILIQFQDILASAQASANSLAKIDTIEKVINSLPPTLDAIDHNNENRRTFPSSHKNIVHNEKISPQRKFWSTKKKPKKTMSSIKKPSSEDSNTIEIKILSHIQE